MDTGPDSDKDIASRLLAALQQDEFVLYAQSIVPLIAQPAGHPFQEIYVRFREEDAKLIPPGSFFPMLDDCNMLPYLDRWVVNRLARWVRSGLKLKPDWKVPRCNVNLSKDTLADAQFAQYVLKYVVDSYLTGGVLGFDIPAETAMGNSGFLLSLIAALRPHGCTFTIAGFNGSDSMLSKVEGFEPDFIKISALTLDPARLMEINRMCHAVGAKTIVEQVENARVLEHLRRCKIDFAQGFAISPVEAL